MKHKELLGCLEDLTWEAYIDISDALMCIDKDKLDEEMCTLPQVYSYYHGLMIKAKRDKDIAAKELNQFISRESQKVRENATKKLTDKATMAMVEGSSTFESYQMNAIEADEKYGLMKAIIASLSQKHDFVIQLSSNRRAETKLYNQ